MNIHKMALAALAFFSFQALAAQEVKLGQTFSDCPYCPEMIVIPPGSFDMGSPATEAGRAGDEGPVHRISITRSFALGKTEVTQGQWRAVMGNNPSHFINCGDNCPVENVSWDDAQAFIKELNSKTGKKYRLPSEAEWEYAARAGTSTAFYTGNCIDTGQANYDGKYDYNQCGANGLIRNKTVPVASFPANAFGLHDMSGNVWEWVEDNYHGNYRGAPANGAAWLEEGAKRVLRGGSWDDFPRLARAATRYRYFPAFRLNSFGFRLAMTLP